MMMMMQFHNLAKHELLLNNTNIDGRTVLICPIGAGVSCMQMHVLAVISCPGLSVAGSTYQI